MSKPVVAIVGRPNVGKSTLFNALAGEQISIVKDTPGVTRDRIYADVTWLNYNFTLIDTGGIEPESKDIILSQMREQAEIAIASADVIIFMVDVRQGLVDSDSKVANMLRRSGKPVVLVVNKVDSFQKMMTDVYEFYNLGIGDPVPVSSVGKLGIGDMLDEVVKHFPESAAEDEEDERPRIAIVGKPNVGKSSIINKIVGESRVIVSDIAGTTRDAIDTDITYNGNEYVFIDTAGLRRKNKIKEELERYSIIRTVTAVERADVVLVVIDATEGVTEQDAKIAGIAHERGKGIIVVVNKWDAIEKNDKTIYEHTNRIKDILSFMPYAEILFISAKTGQRVGKIFAEAFAKVAEPYIRQTVKGNFDVAAIAGLLQARCEKLTEIPEKVDFFDTCPDYDVEFFTNKKSKTNPEVCKTMLEAAIPMLEALPQWTDETIHDGLVALAETLGVKNATLMWPVRIAAAGKLVTPGGAVEICRILGRDETLRRLRAGLEKLA